MIYEIIVDSGETANKCTIAPLSSRVDFRIFRVRGDGALGPLSAPILLHHEGECLTKFCRVSAAPKPDRIYPEERSDEGSRLVGSDSASRSFGLSPQDTILALSRQNLTTVRLKKTTVPALASVDCVWRRLPKLLNRIQWSENRQPTLARIPDGFETAYPRVGAPGKDPQGGLATIEALFVAAALLGKYDPTLLSRYHFARKFIELNTERFLELGVAKATPDQFPQSAPAARDSRSRRLNRGRVAKCDDLP